MYIKRAQIINYGPIDHLEIDFPIENDVPKPVLFVGENGSGKSILLSHIVNALIICKDMIYPHTPEVEIDKVYKIRSSSYIKSRKNYYLARFEFEDNIFFEEMRLVHPKQENSKPPEFNSEEEETTWTKIKSGEKECFNSNIYSESVRKKIEGIFSNNCVLYFPSNRFEDPAWLNKQNLIAKAKYMELPHLEGSTERKFINYSPLWDNQNWLFEVIYDRQAFEINIDRFDGTIGNQLVNVPVFRGFSGPATDFYELALQVVRGAVKGNENTRFGIGKRKNRVVSIIEDDRSIVPNIFQLSSGETSLLNLFLSILRDYDMAGVNFSQAKEIRGIVIVDEIDLHLHAVHQHEVLPRLIQMFPRVQFVVTTHSPLFVLGMKKNFGEDGFALYRVPQGDKLSPEEFGEFGIAYETFATTKRYSDDLRNAIDNAQKPVVVVEGKTDIKFIQNAAELLNKNKLIEKLTLIDGGGSGRMTKYWDGISKLPNSIPQKTILLFDCDHKGNSDSKGNLFKRIIPRQNDHPVNKGIENLFNVNSLKRAKKHKRSFIDIKFEHEVEVRGEKKTIPEMWEVNSDEKSNLCDWFCENGTVDDFQHFREIFSLLEDALSLAVVSAE